MTKSGYIKRLPADTYTAQHRGGKGIVGMTTKEEDLVETVMVVHSHSDLLFFTSEGRVFTKRAYQIPEAGRTSKGQNIVNILELLDGERVTAAISIDSYDEDRSLVMITKNGVLKRSSLSEFEPKRRGGKIAITLDEGDKLLYVLCTDGLRHIIVATKNGNAVRFDEASVRLLGRTARGVRGIRLVGDDEVKGVCIVEEGKKLLTITEKGFGKQSEFDEFTCRSRGTIGVCCQNVNEKTGALAAIAAVDDGDDLLMITSSGTMIRTAASEIPTYRRSASGVIVMRLGDDATVVNLAIAEKQAKEEPEENDSAEE